MKSVLLKKSSAGGCSQSREVRRAQRRGLTWARILGPSSATTPWWEGKGAGVQQRTAAEVLVPCIHPQAWHQLWDRVRVWASWRCQLPLCCRGACTGKGCWPAFCSVCFIWFVCLSIASTRVTYHSTKSFDPWKKQKLQRLRDKLLLTHTRRSADASTQYVQTRTTS